MSFTQHEIPNIIEDDNILVSSNHLTLNDSRHKAIIRSEECRILQHIKVRDGWFLAGGHTKEEVKLLSYWKYQCFSTHFFSLADWNPGLGLMDHL